MQSAHSSFFGMNTVISHTVYGGKAKKAAAAAQGEARRLEGLFSRFIPGSDIARLNRSSGGGNVKLSPETCEVLSIGLNCSRDTDGCFDITAGPLVRLWKGGAAPSEMEIAAARELTGFSTLSLDRSGRMASLAKAGQCVDLGGIGKGYAADRMLSVFRKHRVTSAFADFGGNVAVLGAKPDGTPWKIGIRHPQQKNALVGVLAVTDQSAVTSGDDQRAVRGADGKLRSHIINPRTGMPAQSDLLSVTVVSPLSTAADALATALFIAGIDDGLRFLGGYPGTEALFIDRELSVFLTHGLTGGFRAAEGIKTYLV